MAGSAALVAVVTRPARRLERRDRLAKLATSDRALACMLVFGASIFWLAPRPPMADLPQHVAQVVLWKDLILGQSPFADLFRINLLTPYLAGYGPALLLSFVMPATAAFKLMLSLAFIAFVLSARQLLDDAGGDRRYAWLAMPGFFGFSFDLGFFTFLVAAPLVLQFLRLALRQARMPSWQGALGLVALGVLLLFSHGLSFLFAVGIGGLWMLALQRSWRGALLGCAPYAVLGIACVAYFVASRSLEAPADISEFVWMRDPWLRPGLLLVFVQSNTTLLVVPLTIVLLMVLRHTGSRWRWRMAVPALATLGILLLGPDTVLATDYVQPRFALFLLPLLAVAVAPSSVDTVRTRTWFALMVCACGVSLVWHAGRTVAFAIENRDFEAVLAAAEPGRRAVSATLVRDQGSVAAFNRAAAFYQPAWYQVDKGGLIDFNFAMFHPQIVRYRMDRVPRGGFGFATKYAAFDWSAPQARLWDYYFVRRDEPALPTSFTTAPACDVRLVAQSGQWMLFERGACRR